MKTNEQLAEEERHRNFFISTPLPLQRQFHNHAWRYALGEERSRAGRSSFCDAILDFLFWNLGPVVTSGNDPDMQRLRQKAFESFWDKLKDLFPNCFLWNEEDADGKGGLKHSVPGAIRSRKRQRYAERHEADRQFWIVQQADEQDEAQHQQQHQHQQHQQQQQQQPQDNFFLIY